MEQKKFNVLLRDFNKKKPTFYDVLPYFRREWEEGPYNWDKDYKEVPVKTKEELKKWIKERSQYQFWSRCEYEFLIAKWPFGGWKLTEDMEKFITTNPNLKDHKTNIDMCNIITKDMDVIDVHEQIMMNIDIVTDILYDEFLKENAN
jgi:hypothetical protein